MELRRLSTVVALFFSLAVTSWGGVALAVGPDESGPYLGFGVGFGFNNFEDTGSVGIDPGYGFDAWGGYKFNKWVAAELQLEYLNGFKTSVSFLDLDAQAVTFGANLKAFPLASVLGHQIQPFLLAGPGFSWFGFDAGSFGRADGLGFSARFGGGIDFYVTEHVALQVSSSYVLTTGDVDGLDYVSLVAGIQYKF